MDGFIIKNEIHAMSSEKRRIINWLFFKSFMQGKLLQNVYFYWTGTQFYFRNKDLNCFENQADFAISYHRYYRWLYLRAWVYYEELISCVFHLVA